MYFNKIKDLLSKPRAIPAARRKIADPSLRAPVIWRSLRSQPTSQYPLAEHLNATYSWLRAAQDATSDQGVAASYSLTSGWSTSYPETTGYIIPTFLACAVASGKQDAKQRAIQMADWEIEVQLPNGAVRSGRLDTRVAPAVFNTGQVLFGWNAAFAVSSDERYAQAVQRAASWLLEAQDADGAWRKNLSALTTSDVQTYNSRTAWALAQSGILFDRSDWVDAARRNCTWAMGQQNEAGWFSNNTMHPEEAPLLHTICYAIEGIYGVGVLTGDAKLINCARRTTDALVERYLHDGKSAGCYGASWEPLTAWRCLTGEAQLAGILLRFSALNGDLGHYRKVALRLVWGICGLQEMNPRYRAIFGGVGGSHPIWGAYQSYMYVNWAAKFHLDSLLLLLHNMDPHDLTSIAKVGVT